MADQLLDPSIDYDPALKAEVTNWLLSQNIIIQEKEELDKLVHAIRTNQLMYAIDLLNQVMNVKGSKLALTGNASSIASDLRAEITKIQKDFNDQSKPDPADPQKMADLVKWVDGLENFLKYQSTDPKVNPTGKANPNPILDDSTDQNMLQALSTLKQQFTEPDPKDPKKTINHWGKTDEMAKQMKDWIDQSTGKGSTPATFSPQLNAIQNTMQTLNQSTSAFSTVTNTLMQEAAQYYQQMMATLSSIMQGCQDLNSSSVKRQIAS